MIKNYSDIFVGQKLYHYIFGELTVIATQKSEDNYYVYVNTTDNRKLNFNSDSFNASIISDNPMDVLKLFFKNKALDRFKYSINLRTSNSQFPDAIRNYTHPIERKANTEKFIKYFKEFSYGFEKLEDDIDFDEFNSNGIFYFPLLQGWERYEDAKTILHSRELPILRTNNIVPVNPKGLFEKIYPVFNIKKPLKVNEIFYKHDIGKLPLAFEKYNSRIKYSEADTILIKIMIEQLNDYANELKEIVCSDIPQGESLDEIKEKDSNLFEKENQMFLTVAKPFFDAFNSTKVDKPSRKFISYANSSDGEEIEEFLPASSYLGEIVKNIPLIRNPYFARIGDTYLTTNLREELKKHNIVLWNSKEAKKFYSRNQNSLVYYYAFSPAEKENEYNEYIDETKSILPLLAINKGRIVKNVVPTLSEEQYEYITLNPKNNICINGSAGTGKTTVISHRMASNFINGNNKMALISANSVLTDEAKAIIASLSSVEINPYIYENIDSYLEDVISKSIGISKDDSLKQIKLKAEDDKKSKEFVDIIINKKHPSRKEILSQKEEKLFKNAPPEIRNTKINNFVEDIRGISLSYAIYKLNTHYNKEKENKRYNDFIKKVLAVDKSLFANTINDDELNEDGNFAGTFYKFSVATEIYNYYKNKGEWEQFESDLKQYVDIQNFRKSIAKMGVVELQDIIDYVGVENIGKINILNALTDSGKHFEVDCIFLDEYENIPSYAVESVMKHSPTSRFEFYGDMMQKVIKEKTFEFGKDFEIYNLQRNYRVPNNICKYLKEKYSQFPVQKNEFNIEGSISEISAEDFSNIYIDAQSKYRIAFIYKKEFKNDVLNLLKDYENESINEINEKNSMVLPYSINLIPIDLVSGMEFEKVYVYSKEMNDNEKYVAFTRTLDKLVVIK